MTNAGSQLADIHTMLVSGQRSVRVEPHTLLIWGIAGVFSILIYEFVINPEQNFSVTWHGEVVASVFFAMVLLVIMLLDYRITQRQRNHRDESLPFVHRQLRKMVYLLFAIMVAIYLGMTFYGGWGTGVGAHFALMGVGFFVYGLFSVQILSWIGVLLIIMGIVFVAIRLTDPVTTCLFGSVFGIGMPILALVLDKPYLHSNHRRRICLSVVWLLSVIVPAMTTYHLIREKTVNLPIVSLQEYLAQDETDREQIVHLHKGTQIPIRIRLRGNAMEELVTTTKVPALLANNIDAVVEGDTFDRALPVDWDKEPIIYIRDDVDLRLTPAEGPVLDYSLHYSVYY